MADRPRRRRACRPDRVEVRVRIAHLRRPELAIVGEYRPVVTTRQHARRAVVPHIAQRIERAARLRHRGHTELRLVARPQDVELVKRLENRHLIRGEYRIRRGVALRDQARSLPPEVGRARPSQHDVFIRIIEPRRRVDAARKDSPLIDLFENRPLVSKDSPTRIHARVLSQSEIKRTRRHILYVEIAIVVLRRRPANVHQRAQRIAMRIARRRRRRSRASDRH